MKTGGMKVVGEGFFFFNVSVDSNQFTIERCAIFKPLGTSYVNNNYLFTCELGEFVEISLFFDSCSQNPEKLSVESGEFSQRHPCLGLSERLIPSEADYINTLRNFQHHSVGCLYKFLMRWPRASVNRPLRKNFIFSLNR